MVVWVAGFRRVDGEIGADDVWFSGLIQSREEGEGRWWWSTAVDGWVGDRWSPSLVGDAWWSQTVDGGEARRRLVVPVRGGDARWCRERERRVEGSGV